MDRILAALRKLERLGYLLSTEISLHEIAMIPNFNMAWYNPQIEAFCWCLEAHGDDLWN